MNKWAIGVAAIVALLAAAFWWLLLDAGAPARAPGEFQLEAYRALVENDAPEALPREVRVEFVGQSQAPAFAAMAGDFSGERTFVYTAFQLPAAGGDIVIDAAVDADTLVAMSDGEGSFDADAYRRTLEAIAGAGHVLITHEHLDHVMGIARHPAPEAIAPRLRLTRAQLAALPEHAPDGVLAPAIANVSALDFTAPTRIAPGVVAHAAPGHTPGTIVIYARTPAREYFFIGDIAWLMANIERLRGRPRLLRWIVPGVDPDRAAVLRQLRALHDMAEAHPELVIVPAHDAHYLRGLVETGAIGEGFAVPGPPPS